MPLKMASFSVNSEVKMHTSEMSSQGRRVLGNSIDADELVIAIGKRLYCGDQGMRVGHQCAIVPKSLKAEVDCACCLLDRRSHVCLLWGSGVGVLSFDGPFPFASKIRAQSKHKSIRRDSPKEMLVQQKAAG